MKRALIIAGIVALVLGALLPLAYRKGIAILFGPHIDILAVPFEKTLKSDSAVFPKEDTVSYAGLSFVVPAGATVVPVAHSGEHALCSLKWDSIFVLVVINSDSTMVSHHSRITEKWLNAKWSPVRLFGKAMILQGPFKELAHIRTPFMEGYGWEKTGEEDWRYQYELTDGKAMVTLLVKVKQDSSAVKSIENVVASIRRIPEEQQP
ncbi:hypothetical protein E3J62_12710 [candidate division TA06 bacterium]|uniref:Uncharacterized protein n=1 Tax=candidate division TA06 bacterium TaxID=2250710 RepID=A0A523UMC0_UNCT6|nr:MAG: hypothetical protein E3J62_12710 [candidate division TA06 bacterium]